MSEQYFQGIRVGDKIWTIQEGWTEVENINKEGDTYQIETTNEDYTIEGKYLEEDQHQSAFWSDPGIVAPPRPKRMKKVTIEVRPYWYKGMLWLDYTKLPASHDDYCGPVQTITVEVEE